MFKLIQPKHQLFIGIDINVSAVSLLALSKKGNLKPRIEAYGRELYTSSVFDGSIIKDTSQVSYSIKELISRFRLNCKRAAIAIPDSVAIKKIIHAPNNLNDKELEEWVILESEQFIPYSIEEFYFDFQVIGPSLKSSQSIDVLVIATKIEQIETRINVLKGAGLVPVAVDIESYTMERAFRYFFYKFFEKHPFNHIAVVEVRSEDLQFWVSNGTNLIYFDKMVFIEKMHPSIKNESLAIHINSFLQAFYATNQGAVDSIFLIGELAGQVGLASQVQMKCAVNTNFYSLLEPPIPNNVDFNSIKKDVSSLMRACGLGLRKKRFYYARY